MWSASVCATAGVARCVRALVPEKAAEVAAKLAQIASDFQAAAQNRSVDAAELLLLGSLQTVAPDAVAAMIRKTSRRYRQPPPPPAADLPRLQLEGEDPIDKNFPGEQQHCHSHGSRCQL